MDIPKTLHVRDKYNNKTIKNKRCENIFQKLQKKKKKIKENKAEKTAHIRDKYNIILL